MAVAEIKRHMCPAALGATETHVCLMRSDDPRVAQRSASEILDRVGVGSKGTSGNEGGERVAPSKPSAIQKPTLRRSQ